MGRGAGRVESHIICLAPAIRVAGKLVRHHELLAGAGAERGHVEPDGCLPRLVRIDVNDDQNRVALTLPALRSDALREAEYLRLVAVMKTQVPEPVQGRMCL